jgi:hypothetical protein
LNLKQIVKQTTGVGLKTRATVMVWTQGELSELHEKHKKGGEIS